MSAPNTSAPTLPRDTLSLVFKVLQNAVSNSSDLSKYGKINLEGKAGGRLRQSPAAMSLLTEAGFVIVESDLILLEVIDATEATLSTVVAQRCASSASAPAPAPAPAPKLSMKQQANRDREERERLERLAAQNKRSKPNKLSFKQQALKDKDEADATNSSLKKKEEKAELLKKVEEDNHVRKNDENWSVSERSERALWKTQSINLAKLLQTVISTAPTLTLSICLAHFTRFVARVSSKNAPRFARVDWNSGR